MKRISFILLFTICSIFVSGQIITSTPALPKSGDETTIIFDAKLGNGALSGYTGDVYAHTGVITSNSNSDSDWQYVIAEWNQNIEKAKLSALGDDKYQLVLSPSIKEFYGVSEGETIQKLAFVFRNADGSLIGKTESNQDIFYNVYQSGLAVNISMPDQQPFFVDASASFTLKINGVDATTTTVKIDGNLVHTESTTPNSFEYQVQTEALGSHEIIVEAKDGTNSVSDNFVYVCRTNPIVEELSTGIRDGINYINDNTVTLVIHAPYKNSVYAFGSFNNWQPIAMKRTKSDINDPDLRYWITITGLDQYEEYILQYIIDENMRLAEPYAEKILDPYNDNYISNSTYPDLVSYPKGKTEGLAAVFQIKEEEYNWETHDFVPPKKEDLVIYELLIRDFAEEANYQTLIDTIGYFKRLGVNAIELMPTNEFEGNDSWGYNPSFYFAVDKAYGTKNKLKEFIDVCHKNGIAVFLDIVLNHSFSQSPFVQMYFDANAGSWGQPTSQSPWYNQTSPNPDFNWGYDFDHESAATQALVDSVNGYWLREFNVDGIRFDFTKGFTNTAGNGQAYDQARVDILTRMFNHIKSVNENAYVIFEHITDNDEEKVLTDLGILFWGKLSDKYTEAAMGYHDNSKSDLSWGVYTERDWTVPNLITYMESHDEERMMFKMLNHGNSSGSYSTQDLTTALKRIELAACFFFTLPGPKMLWQFGEYGYDVSIDENGRTSKKPLKWEYLQDDGRKKLFDVYSSLIMLKTEYDVFETSDFTFDLSGAVKRINLNGADMDITILGNFDVVEKSIFPNFQSTGTWYEYFAEESIEVDDVNQAITLKPGEYRLYSSVEIKESYAPTSFIELSNNNKTRIDIKTFPNPATDKIFLEFKMSDKIEDAAISLYNIHGKKIADFYKGDLNTGINKYEFLLNEGIAKGAYLLKVESANFHSSEVLIVE